MKNNKLILKLQQTSTSKKCKAFTEEVNRFALFANDYKKKTIKQFNRNICI